jgi:hypothetical protein
MYDRDSRRIYSQYPAGSRQYPHMEDAMTRILQTAKCGLPNVPSSRMSVGRLHSRRTDNRPWTSSTVTKSHLTEHDQVAPTRAPRTALVGSMATVLETVYPDSTNNQLRQTLGPWTRPDLRIWHTYYDSSSQKLCQMVNQQTTVPRQPPV